MSPFEILAAGGAVAILLVLMHIVTTREISGNALVAAGLSAAFAGFTAITVLREGPFLFWFNHTANLWGVQVWYDLLIAVSIALLFIVPRARRAGMNVPLWVLAVGLTASIALLAMVARLFWLERGARAEPV